MAPGADKTTVAEAVRDWLAYGRGQVDDKANQEARFHQRDPLDRR